MVDTIDEHRGAVLGRSGHDHLLGAGLDVLAGGLVGEEETGGLDDDLGADLIPLQVGGIHLGGDTDLLAVHDEGTILSLHIALESSVDGVILEHVSEVVRIEQVVDADHLDIIGEILNRGAEDHTADTAEAVNTKFNHLILKL